MNEPDPQTPVTISPSRLVAMGIFVEGLLVVLALVVAWLFGFHDNAMPLATFFSGNWAGELAIGSVIAVPLLFGVMSLEKIRFGPITKFFEYIDRYLTPLLAPMNWWQAAILSLMAGIGEEIFFRWCIQGGLTQLMHPAFAIAIAATIFGLMHCITLIYFLLTTVVGVLLGVIYIYWGPLAAIACHAMYDFLAIAIVIQKAKRSGHEQDQPNEAVILSQPEA